MRDPDRISHGIRCRLLYLVGQLRLGGLERQLYYILANLDHTRYFPAVVVWNLNLSDKYYGDIQALKVPIFGFPAEWSPLSKLRALRVLTRQLAPEVIHSYGFHTNFAAYYGALGTRALAIGSLRSDFAHAKAEGGVLRSVLNARWPSCFIANSMSAAEAVRRQAGFFAPRQIAVVRNGLDLQRFTYAKEVIEVKSYIAAVGSLFPVKRWDRLLKMIFKLEKVCKDSLFFRIAGDGPLRGSLEKQAQDLGIAKSVNFEGAIQDMPGFLRGAKFLVHTSESEGCPNAVMEAMASGLAVVAMEAGDISHLVEEGKTGFIVSQDDEERFVECVFQLHSDRALRCRMGLAARDKAEHQFSVERLVTETLAVYKIAGWKDLST
jgi:glycosyltransferase involved in cell wall biosynthesis